MDFWRRSVFCALSFLTILKLPPRLTEGADFSKSTYTFTAVGLVIGVGLMLVHLIFGAVAPFFMVLYLAVITGFLHIDGLADTFDALFSSRSRERMLEIMKDSRIGAMGAAAIILSLAGKFFAFTLLDSLWLMVLIPAISRFAMVVLLYRMPYVRKEGLGKTFSAPYKPDLFWQIIPVICLALLFTGPLKVGILIVAFIFIYQITEMWYQRKIGGITGDLTGALCEIMETGLFLTAAMVAS